MLPKTTGRIRCRNTNRNRRLRPVRHNISNEDLHTGVDEYCILYISNRFFTSDSAVGSDTIWLRSYMFCIYENNLSIIMTAHKTVETQQKVRQKGRIEIDTKSQANNYSYWRYR
jgi:hypothetical protein